MRCIVKAFRRPPTGRIRDPKGGLPRLSDVVAHALRCPASPRRTLLAENLGRPSQWVIISDLWYKGRVCFTEAPFHANPPLQERSERIGHRQNQKGDSQRSRKVIQAMSWDKGGQPWMTRPYSGDLRERGVRVVESGTSRIGAAKQVDVSFSFVVKLMQRWNQREKPTNTRAGRNRNWPPMPIPFGPWWRRPATSPSTSFAPFWPPRGSRRSARRWTTFFWPRG